MKFYRKKRTGLTLVEILLVLGLISMIFGLSANLVIAGSRTHKVTVKEYDMQSHIRVATEKTNEAVRYSKAIFAVPETFVSSTDVMDPDWNYLMATPDGKRIVNMVYDENLGKHVENVIVTESADILYYIKFENDSSVEHNNVLQYKIYAYNTNKFGQKVNEKLIFESSVDAVNAIQTVDKGSSTSPSVALAYRSDGQTSGKGKNQIAYITIIIDISNSMNLTPDDGGSTTIEKTTSRITKVRQALIGSGGTTDNAIIQMFSKEENVFLSLVPFANTANFPSPHANSNKNGVHEIFEAYKSSDLNSLITTIKDMKADGHNSSKYGSGKGGTNTGDGLRRAYYLHNTFRTRMADKGMPIDEKDQVHHYIILLVDGETTFQVNNGVWKDNGSYKTRTTGSGWSIKNVTEKVNGTNYTVKDWVTSWSYSSTSNSFYNLDGNIELTNVKPADAPTTDRTVNSGSKEVRYGAKNSNVDSYSITGNGSTVISNGGYVTAMGNLIKGFDSNSGIQSYLIGYASNLTNEIKNLGNAIGTDTQNRYVYSSSNFNLDEIFMNIAQDIMADYWLAAGPQIIKE